MPPAVAWVGCKPDVCGISWHLFLEDSENPNKTQQKPVLFTTPTRSYTLGEGAFNDESILIKKAWKVQENQNKFNRLQTTMPRQYQLVIWTEVQWPSGEERNNQHHAAILHLLENESTLFKK